MNAADVRTVGIVGAGVMGRGVRVAVAHAGLDAILVDRSEEVLARSRAALRDDLRAYQLLSGDRSTSTDDLLGATVFTADAGELARADLVIENATERWDVKRPIYERIDGICAPDVVFAVNTSAIPITRLAALTARAERVVGMHFMNPAALKPTVELVRGERTSAATIEFAQAFLARIGKAGIVVNDAAGFVTNRVMMLTVNEAIFLLQEGVASAADIDRLFVRCFGHRMGPLETADLIGLDTVLLSIEVLHDAFGTDKFRPCPLLRTMVEGGRLGRKSGQGFFSYGVAAGGDGGREG